MCVCMCVAMFCFPDTCKWDRFFCFSVYFFNFCSIVALVLTAKQNATIKGDTLARPTSQLTLFSPNLFPLQFISLHFLRLWTRRAQKRENKTKLELKWCGIINATHVDVVKRTLHLGFISTTGFNREPPEYLSTRIALFSSTVMYTYLSL